MEIVKLFLEMGAGPIDSFEDSHNSPLCKASSVRIIYHCIGLHFFLLELTRNLFILLICSSERSFGSCQVFG